MDNKKGWIVGIIIIVIAMLGYGYYKNTDKTEGDSIKIGSILILSGEGATWGEAARNGINLAVKEINAQGGVNGKSLEAIHEDDGSSPSKGISAFNKLTDSDGVKFIIGPNWSNVGTALVELIKQKKTVVISPSLGVKEFNEGTDYAFNMWPHDYLLSRNLAEYVYGKGYRNVALLGANDVWVKDQTMAFKERFESLGGKIALVYEPLVTETDVRTEMLKIKSDKTIDAIVMTTDSYSLTNIIAKQVRDLGIMLPKYSITIDRSIITNCNGACDGMVFLTFLTPTADFEAKYKLAYDREVEIGSDSAYDAVMLLAQAMRETKSSDPATVQQYLRAVTGYNGASGMLTSDGKGAFTKPYVTKRIDNGAPITISQ